MRINVYQRAIASDIHYSLSCTLRHASTDQQTGKASSRSGKHVASIARVLVTLTYAQSSR